VHRRVRRNESMSQARRRLEIRVQLPVPAQGSFLDFAFAQEDDQCCGNGVGALAKLFRQVALADDHVPGWVALMDFATVGRNLIGERAKFFLPVTLGTFDSGLIGFQIRSARNRDPDSTGDHRAGSPVQGNPQKTTCEGIHHLE